MAAYRLHGAVAAETGCAGRSAGARRKLPDRLIESTLQPIQPAPQQWAYNHSLSLLRDKAGRWGLRRQTGGIEAINECHLAHPDLLDLLQELDLDYRRAERLTLRRGSDGRMMLIFEIGAEDEPELTTDLPLSVNLICPIANPSTSSATLFSNYAIADLDFRVTAGSFMRTNISGIEILGSAVMKLARLQGSERLLDLYAGVGIFSAFLASAAELVTLVESLSAGR